MFCGAAALFSAVQKMKQDEAKPQLSTKVKKKRSSQHSSICPGDGLHGVCREKPCEGREPLRADEAAAFAKWHQGRATLTGNKQVQEKRSGPVTLICCRSCKTLTLLRSSLTSRNLSRTTLLLFQLHCVFVSLFFSSLLFFLRLTVCFLRAFYYLAPLVSDLVAFLSSCTNSFSRTPLLPLR